MPADRAAIAASFSSIQERVARAADRCGRDASTVTIIAVSKTFAADAVRAAFDAGARHFAENRVQEWESKRTQLPLVNADLVKAATWHMIGHVQGNKAARVAQLFDRVDSLDRTPIAQKLDAAAAVDGNRLPVLIEVHLGGETTKTGAAESELNALAESAIHLDHLDLQGLMTIPPYFDNPELARPYFRKLRELRDALSAHLNRPLPVLSMGMSHDFEVAIEEGATEIRIGTAIFGDRPSATPNASADAHTDQPAVDVVASERVAPTTRPSKVLRDSHD